jgi:hypothetical protein
LTRSRAVTVLAVLGLLGGHNSVSGWGHFVPIVFLLLVLLHHLDKAHEQKPTSSKRKADHRRALR